MTARGNGEPAISERELAAMTAELDLLHRETFPAVRRTLEELRANLAHLRAGSGTQPARRSFLLGAGGAAAIGGLAACTGSGSTTTATDGATSLSTTSSSSGPTTSASPTSGPTGYTDYTGDMKIVALAAALENLAVAAYAGALRKARAGRLGTVPKAVSTFVVTAMGQHEEHALAWNGVLGQAGKAKITGTPLTIARRELAKLQAAGSVADVAELALGLENVAAQTYTLAAADVKDVGGIMTAAAIQPVEAMHAAILNFVLGRYPVPSPVIGTRLAAQPDWLTA